MAVGQQVQSMTAVVHRLQRPYDEREPLGSGEFIAYACCSRNLHQEEHSAAHLPRIGVYRAIPLGTIVGGNLFRKVESYLRIKLANFRQWLQS